MTQGSRDLEAAGPGSGRPWRRWLLRALIVLAVLQGLYFALANAFLRTSAGHRLINRRPEQFQISWGSARTFWPGRIHLTDVYLKSQSRQVRWELELDRAILSFSVPALALKRFSTRRIAGHGLEFRLLRRPEPGEPLPASGVVPEISFPGPLAHPAGGERPPPPRWPWTLSLSGIEVDGVREVWLEDQRFVGDGRVSGGVWLKIRGALEIEPSTIELVDGRITNGDEVVSEKALLVVEAHSDRFVPSENRGLAALGFMTGRIRFESPRTGFGFLDGYFQKAPWVDVGGTGDVRVDVTADHGRLSPGSLVTVESQDLTVAAIDIRAAGLGKIRAEVNASTAADGAETLLTANLHDFEIADGEGGPTLVHGSGLALVARGKNADLVDGFGHLDVELTIPRSEVPDLSAFNALLPAGSDLRFQSGSGEFQGRLTLDSTSQSGNGELEVRGDGVGLKFQDSTVVGDVRVIARLRGADLVARRYDISGSQVKLERFRVAHAENGAEETGWWGEFELREGELRAGKVGEAASVDALLSARIRDSGPLAAYLAERSRKLRWFRDLMTIEDVTAEGRLRTDAETFSVDGVRITGEKLEILATALNLTRGQRDGLFFFKLGPLSAGVEIEGQRYQWKLTHPRRWYEQRAAAMEARDGPSS